MNNIIIKICPDGNNIKSKFVGELPSRLCIVYYVTDELSKYISNVIKEYHLCKNLVHLHKFEEILKDPVADKQAFVNKKCHTIDRFFV